MVASRFLKTDPPEYIGKEVAYITDYEIIMVFLGILALLISSSGLIIALLTFLDKRNKRKNNAHPVGKRNGRLSLRGK